MNKEVFMLYSYDMKQPYYLCQEIPCDSDDEKDDDSDDYNEFICICFEKESDALYYLSCMKKKDDIYITKVNCMSLCKMIEESNFEIGVIIKKQSHHFMRYLEYMSIAFLEYSESSSIFLSC